MSPEQVRSPLELVTVQPLAPEPPAKRTSPVEEAPMETVPEVPASMVKLVAAVETEMAGVTPVKLKLPPREVKLAPETVKVLSRVAAPCKVKAPGVVVEPIVLMEESPEPKVLVVPAPVARVVLPEEVRVVKAPVPGVVAPMEGKLAAPVPAMFHWASVIATSAAAWPIAIESAPVAPVPIAMVSTSVPVPILIARAMSVEPRFKVVAALARLKVAEVVVRSPPFKARSSAVVTRPAWVTEKLVEVIRLVPKVPERLRPLVMLAPVILMASVTVSWLPVAVSLLARSSKAETVASVEEESFWAKAMRAAVSVLPAMEVAWVN